MIATATASPVLLNLTSSSRHLGGFINVDIVPPADLIANLNEPWPWEDSSIDGIVFHDGPEHLFDPIHTMNELWRVLKPGSQVEIVVPTTDGRGWAQDPTHKAFPPFNRNSFFYYTAGDPHREDFGEAYGVKARFKVIKERELMLLNGVSKLTIILEAVK